MKEDNRPVIEEDRPSRCREEYIRARSPEETEYISLKMLNGPIWPETDL